jgi:hypothetical protein
MIVHALRVLSTGLNSPVAATGSALVPVCLVRPHPKAKHDTTSSAANLSFMSMFLRSFRM